MEATFSREALTEALTEAGAVIPARSPKPILQSVRIEIGDEPVVIATDLDVSVRRRVDGVDVKKPGVAVIPAAKLRSILSTSDDDDVAISASGDSAKIRCKRSSFTLPLANPDEYPVVEDFGDRPYLAVESRHMGDSIRRTIFAIDEASTRYALGGIQLCPENGRLRVVSADGRRAAICRMDFEECGEGVIEDWSNHPPIVPVKGLRLLSRAIADGDPPVHMALLWSEKPTPVGILFRTECSVIYSRLVEGRFPDVSQLPRPASPVAVDIQSHALRRAVEHASVFVSEISLAIDFTFGPSSLVLSGWASDAGESSVELDCLGPPDSRTMAYYPGYVVDPLKALEKDAIVRLGVATAKDPLWMSVGDDYEYAVMPITRDS